MRITNAIIFIVVLILIAGLSFLLGKQFSETGIDQYPKRGTLQQDILLKDFKLKFDPIESNTNSMAPTFGKGNILIVSNHTQDLSVGDIVGFGDNVIVTYHRIIKIGEDEQGWYAITKGDNNILPLNEEKKLRRADIYFVVHGVLY